MAMQRNGVIVARYWDDEWEEVKAASQRLHADEAELALSWFLSDDPSEPNSRLGLTESFGRPVTRLTLEVSCED